MEVIILTISKRNASILLLILILGTIAVKQLYAVSPSPAGGGFLDLRGVNGGYYYVKDEKRLLGSALEDGMTIEFWVYLTRPAKEGEWWNLVSKPFNLKPWIIMYGIIAEDFPSGDKMWIRGGYYGGGSGIISFSPTSFKPQWLHIAWQGKIGKEPGDEEGILLSQDFVNGKFKSNSSGDSVAFLDNNFPLYIGGLPLKSVQTFDGLIDEVRISNICRYATLGQEEPKVRTRLKSDKWTVALWHFDEGARATSYADSSGNGYTLLAGGSLAVSLKEKLSICWGRLKKAE